MYVRYSLLLLLLFVFSYLLIVVFMSNAYRIFQDSSKGGAVETGCSDFIWCYALILLHTTTPIYCTPVPLHPPVMNTQYF